jgi:hypothetical protein
MAATSRAFFDVPDDYVPRTNDDMYRTYGSFVARLVTRYNRVTSNYEDLLQHVWYKLIEVDLIGKYNVSGSLLPKKLTALQACSHLQIQWGQFKVLMWRGHKGENRQEDRNRSVSKEILVRVFERDHGVCHCCGSDMDLLSSKLERMKASTNPVVRECHVKAMKQLGLNSKKRILWYVEKMGKLKGGSDPLETHVTTCFSCMRKRTPVRVKSRSEWVPTPVEGTWASKKAIYTRESIERLRIIRENKKNRCKKHLDIDPLVFNTKSFFKLYLARSVHNIYANWCRTRDRRYKEHFPGIDAESGKSWEETLEDPTGPRQENLLAVYEAAKVIAYGDRNGGGDSKVHEEVLALAAEGHTLAEIIQKLSLPKTALNALQGG